MNVSDYRGSTAGVECTASELKGARVKLPADWPERNVELLRATMKFIEQHPEKHEQGQWATQCGTATIAR